MELQEYFNHKIMINNNEVVSKNLEYLKEDILIRINDSKIISENKATEIKNCFESEQLIIDKNLKSKFEEVNKTIIESNKQTDEKFDSLQETIKKFDKYIQIVDQKINENTNNDLDTSSNVESQIAAIKNILKQNKTVVDEFNSKFEEIDDHLK
jgi:molecular chaperone DnaK (HSP70)